MASLLNTPSKLRTQTEWVSNCCLMPSDQLHVYHGRKRLGIHEMMMKLMSAFLDVIVLAHQNNSP